MNDDGPQEQFLGFHKYQTGVSGEAIAKNILEKLANNWQLGPRLLSGQAYDRAGAMADRVGGIAAHILSIYPKAVYTIVLLIGLIFPL